MLYAFVKVIARLAIKLYCRDIALHKKEILKLQGPLLLAVNHPNSFLDAIILCTLFDKPVYSLARGDAFKNKFFAKILYQFKMFPVYRVSEGVENMDENYKTFDLCKEVFKQKGIVLIFSEGKCINEWHLRPLKKGTARLAISSWEDGIALKVLPVGINYNSFKRFGKNVKLFFGDFIVPQTVDLENGLGKAIQSFNNSLQQQLQSFVFEIDKTDSQQLHKTFYVNQSFIKKNILFIPAIFGWLINAPLYYPLKKYAIAKNKKNDHFDSLIVAILLLGYPLYLIIITAVLFSITKCWFAFLLLIIAPATAWAYVQLKKQLDV